MDILKSTVGEGSTKTTTLNPTTSHSWTTTQQNNKSSGISGLDIGFISLGAVTGLGLLSLAIYGCIKVKHKLQPVTLDSVEGVTVINGNNNNVTTVVNVTETSPIIPPYIKTKSKALKSIDPNRPKPKSEEINRLYNKRGANNKDYVNRDINIQEYREREERINKEITRAEENFYTELEAKDRRMTPEEFEQKQIKDLAESLRPYVKQIEKNTQNLEFEKRPDIEIAKEILTCAQEVEKINKVLGKCRDKKILNLLIGEAYTLIKQGYKLSTRVLDTSKTMEEEKATKNKIKIKSYLLARASDFSTELNEVFKADLFGCNEGFKTLKETIERFVRVLGRQATTPSNSIVYGEIIKDIELSL